MLSLEKTIGELLDSITKTIKRKLEIIDSGLQPAFTNVNEIFNIHRDLCSGEKSYSYVVLRDQFQSIIGLASKLVNTYNV